MWVLMPFQGAAHYMYDAVITDIEDIKGESIVQILINGSMMHVKGMEAMHIDLYSMTGQLIKSTIGVNELPIAGLQGVYLVMIKDVNNEITTKKIIIR